MALKLGGCGTEHVYHRHLSTTASAERPLAFSVVTDRFARCPDLSDATEHSACHAARPPSSMRPRPVELSYSAHRPADHPAREQVDHGRHIEPAFNRPDVGEVGNPFLIRPRGRELSVQQVGRYGTAICRSPSSFGSRRRRGRARKACNRISRSIRCRPQSMPSASRSRQTRRAP